MGVLSTTMEKIKEKELVAINPRVLCPSSINESRLKFAESWNLCHPELRTRQLFRCYLHLRQPSQLSHPSPVHSKGVARREIWGVHKEQHRHAIPLIPVFPVKRHVLGTVVRNRAQCRASNLYGYKSWLSHCVTTIMTIIGPTYMSSVRLLILEMRLIETGPSQQGGNLSSWARLHNMYKRANHMLNLMNFSVHVHNYFLIQ
jgi:hypothetical protein